MAAPRKPISSRRTTQSDDQQMSASHSRADRRRKIIAIVVIAGLLLSSGGAVVAVIIGSLAGGGSTPATTVAPTPTQPPPALLNFPVAGASADADVACPEPDGSSPRTTSFAAAPPTCLATTPDGAIDPTVDYRAVITTSTGDLTYLLTTSRAPETVNTFVFLARYGFWDGAPFDAVLPLAWAETGTEFSGPPNDGDAGTRPPGFVIASEAPADGTVSTPGMLAMAPSSTGDSQPGRLIVALGDRAAGLPVTTTFFGVLLDGSDTLAALQRAGTDDGRPSQQITINAITVDEES